MKKNKYMLFIHPQKTAGTTIYKTLNQCLKDEIKGAYHSVPAMKDMEEKTVLLSIRDPKEWYVSMWSHLRRGPSKPQAIGAWRMCPKKDRMRLYGEDTPECFREWFKEAIFHIEHSGGLYTHRIAIMTRCRLDLIDYVVHQDRLVEELRGFIEMLIKESDENPCVDGWKEKFDKATARRFQKTKHGNFDDYYTDNMIRMLKQQDFLIYDNFYQEEALVSHGMLGCPFLEKFQNGKFVRGVYEF